MRDHWLAEFFAVLVITVSLLAWIVGGIWILAGRLGG
jgi:uncharacterized protein YneF (UPF0154 family)